MEYIELHKKVGFEVGERVILETSAESGEKGWSEIWLREMNVFIGKTGIIQSDNGTMGFSVKFAEDKPNYNYPAFVLKLEKKRRSKKQTAQSMKNFASGTVTGQINLLSNFEQKNKENQFLTRDQLEQMQKCIIHLKILRQLLKKLT